MAQEADDVSQMMIPRKKNSHQGECLCCRAYQKARRIPPLCVPGPHRRRPDGRGGSREVAAREGRGRRVGGRGIGAEAGDATGFGAPPRKKKVSSTLTIHE